MSINPCPRCNGRMLIGDSPDNQPLETCFVCGYDRYPNVDVPQRQEAAHLETERQFELTGFRRKRRKGYYD